MNLIKGDCLIELKNIPDKSVDFVFLDLPYHCTGCKWDRQIDLSALWKELKRIARNDRTPFFFSCTTKFGYELIKANEKWYRWDLVWKKNRAAGFLNAYKLPLRKHEMIYCFSKKTPEYDVSSHKTGKTKIGNSKGDVYLAEAAINSENYYHKDHTKQILNAPLPTSDVTPQLLTNAELFGEDRKTPLVRTQTKHDERLPTSDITPSSWCEFNNDDRTGHRTAKPVALMKFLLKYWTKPGWTVLDPTMGSGSMGIACKNMSRNFIGIELDPEIYDLAKKRIMSEDQK